MSHRQQGDKAGIVERELCLGCVVEDVVVGLGFGGVDVVDSWSLTLLESMRRRSCLEAGPGVVSGGCLSGAIGESG